MLGILKVSVINRKSVILRRSERRSHLKRIVVIFMFVLTTCMICWLVFRVELKYFTTKKYSRVHIINLNCKIVINIV